MSSDPKASHHLYDIYLFFYQNKNGTDVLEDSQKIKKIKRNFSSCDISESNNFIYVWVSLN